MFFQRPQGGTLELTYILVLKDLGVTPVGVAPPELPHVEEGPPVDVRDQQLQVVLHEFADAEEGWVHWINAQFTSVMNFRNQV